MERKRYFVIICSAMKISLLQILLSAIFSFSLFAKVKTAESQTILKKTVSISAINEDIKHVLSQITDQTGVKFAYSSDIVTANKAITCTPIKRTLSEFLTTILNPLNIDYKVIDSTQILLVPMSEKKKKLQVVEDLIVSGKITDKDGKPLAGASVIIKGTAKGIITGPDGIYSISVPRKGVTLIFSYIGYQEQDIIVGDEKTLNVQLLPGNSQLDQIVVVAYGTQKKATVTGAISSIDAKEITTATNGNVVNLLAGKLPGLRVTQRTGEPGDYATNFDIRGFGAPLVIVDGVPNSNFNHLDPNEIQNISILKDASAAIYGVKGGNGVILVTTKRGSVGKTEFSYSPTFGVTQIANSPNILNSYQYAVLTDESYINAGNTPPYSAEQLKQYQDGTLPNTDWFDLVVRKFAPQQQHSITANGSTGKAKYFLSAGYFGEGGIYKSGDINAHRYNFRSNVTVDLTDNLQAEVLVNGIIDQKHTPGDNTSLIFQELWSQPPTLTPYANNNPDYLNNMFDAANPLAITDSKYSGYNLNNTKTFNGVADLTYKIQALPGLKAKLLYSYNNASELMKAFIKQTDLYSYDEATNTYSVAGSRNAPTTYTERYIARTSTTAQFSLNYQNTFLHNHNVEGLLLVEETKQNGDDFQGSRQFSFDVVDQLYAGNTLNQATTSTQVIPDVNQSLVGRINYNFKTKYILEGSFRYEGSSKFAKGHRWGFFPEISAGWRISEESFLKNKTTFLNNLKLRASYGKVGDDGSSTYQYLTGYTYPGSKYVFDGTLVNGLGFKDMPNELLSWYTNNMTDIGIEADMWNKVHIEADVFRRKRNGLLATRILSLPGTVGANLPQENLNGDLSQGLEFMAAYHSHIDKFNFNISGNISFTRTKNLYVERAAPTNSYDNWRNNNAYRWNDAYWGYKVIGQFQNEEEILSSPVEDGKGNRNILPGDLKYEDLNHDGVIDGNDQQIVGKNSNTPEVNFGLTLSASWKGFDINALFQGATDFTISYLGTIALDGPLAWGRNGLDVFMDRWHHQDLFDPSSPWVAGKYPSTRTKSNTVRSDSWNFLPSDFWLNNATYLRLKSLELGYTLPSKFIGKSGVIKSLRIYINGYDLITWSGLSNLVDPEHPNSDYGNTYPITKNYNFGVNLTF